MPRELTHESDTLLDISGLLNHLHRASRNRFIGASITTFHGALFWVAVPGTDFRHASGKIMYPTWSPAGWKGAVKYGVFAAGQLPLVEQWVLCTTDGKLAIFGTSLSQLRENKIYTSERPPVHDEEAENQRTGKRKFWPNYLE